MAFTIHKYKCSGIEIIDTSEYLKNSIFTVLDDARYTYAESYTVNILYKVDLSQKTTLVDYKIEPHQEGIANKSIINFTQDGLHQVTLLILPNKQWIDTYRDLLDAFDVIYYSDGTSIFDINDNTVAIDDLEVNCSNILSKIKYTFTFEKLLLRFKEESLNVLQNNAKPLIRNILWIGIDVIKYCLSQGWYFEAERRLQQLLNCLNTGSSATNTVNLSNCGCLKTLWMNLTKTRI